MQPPNQPIVWSHLPLGPMREGLCVALSARATAGSTVYVASADCPPTATLHRAKFPAVLLRCFPGPSPLLRAAAEGAPWGAVAPSCQPHTPRSQQVESWGPRAPPRGPAGRGRVPADLAHSAGCGRPRGPAASPALGWRSDSWPGGVGRGSRLVAWHSTPGITGAAPPYHLTERQGELAPAG